ncbi:MAG: acyl-CoA thioesterase [Deltaproteobacteria bacterium]|nr:MAG: acyl-CoA thioesterase [Deltaproteobacteria bacterium]
MAAFEHRLRVRFQHTDPAGIVFFANIFVYCHEAFEEFLRAGGLPLEEFLSGKRKQVLPLGHAEADFKRPFRYGTLVTVRVSVGRVGERSFRLEYELSDEAGEQLATAATAHIAVDRATGQSTALDPQLKSFLEKYARPA